MTWSLHFSHRSTSSALLLWVALVSLGGCSAMRWSQMLGMTASSPDEFQVTTRAPLAMPPSFELRPPRPGAARPQEQSESRQAEEALVPETALARPVGDDSPGQEALRKAAGPPVPANIRQMVNAESADEHPPQSLADRLMFWKAAPPRGQVVDAEREAERLRARAALGQSPVAGQTPIATQPSEGFFGSLF
jgi:hypothetical protein